MEHSSNSLVNCKTKDLYSVDVFKFFCAILVVIIHSNPFIEISQQVEFFFVNIIARIAVPFFFICTGYFTFSKIDKDNIDFYIIKTTIIKMLKLYIIWQIIYSPLTIYFYSLTPSSVGLKTFKIIFIILFDGNNGHLWYLLAVAVALSIIYFLLKKKVKFYVIFAISFLFYLIGLLIPYYNYISNLLFKENNELKILIDKVNSITAFDRNGLFFGLMFLCVGIMLAWWPKNYNFKSNTFKLFISIILLVVEIFCIIKFDFVSNNEKYLFLPLVMYYLTNAIFNIKLSYKPIYSILRKLSMWVYFIHMFIDRIVGFTLQIMFPAYDKYYIRFLLTLVISIICALILMKLSELKKFKWLNQLC